ncbi:MAG: acyl-CoA thioesterase [Chloroflexi bacterium]|nr:acyl-CoA thioesterase [Chloroflexota bacterium]
MSAEKTPSQSRIMMNRLMGPTDANNLGNVHGGIIMKLVDEAGALAAMRHAGSPVVTVQIDSMSFSKPIFVGSLVTLEAECTYAGRTSIEVRVTVKAENPITGEGTTTNHGYLVYVAIDSAGTPIEVPSLIAENEAQARRMEQAQARQAFRKQQSKAEKEIDELDG